MLPPRILSLLEWFGFTADKRKGMQQLLRSYYNPNLRSSIIALFLLSYNLFVTIHLGMTCSQFEIFIASIILSTRKKPVSVFSELEQAF